VLAFYNGLSASILRQATYSTTRFAVYEFGKAKISSGEKDLAFYKKILLAGGSGFLGSIIGNPADLVNVRMQNDVKLPMDQRRNYKHCFEALHRIYSTENVRGLFKGTLMSSSRGALVTVGHLAFYDEIKYQLISSTYFQDDLRTHFLSSIGAAVTATSITMPIDVLKTRLMNSKPGEYSGEFIICLTNVKKKILNNFCMFTRKNTKK